METDLTKLMLVVISWAVVLFIIYANYMYCGFTPKKNPTVTGSIIRSSVSDATVGRGVDIDINYEYFVEGKRYISHRICCGSSGDVSSIVQEYPVGKKVEVYYREKNPSLSALEPKMGRNSKLFLYCWLVILVISHVILFGAQTLINRLIPILLGGFIISLGLAVIISPPPNPDAAALNVWGKLLMVGSCIYLGVILFLTPVFIKKNLITSNYQETNSYGKAKTNLFYYKLFSPLYILFFICYLKVIGLDIKISFAFILLISHLIWSMSTVSKK